MNCSSITKRHLTGGLHVVTAILFVWMSLASARGQERLFEQEPFDRITLDEHNDHKVLKVKPLDLPGRRVPVDPPTGYKLLVRTFEQPDRAYEIIWYSVDKLELFERMVLAEANGLVAAGRLDDAYDYFKFLEEKYPELPGLKEAIEQYLYEEAKVSQVAGQYDGALAVLRELHRRNPEREKLEKALGLATEKLIEQYVAKGDYPAARVLLGNLAAWYPEHAVLVGEDGQEARLKKQAAAALAKARQAEQEGDLYEACRLGRLATRIWPALPEARETAESLHRKHPRVVVGVSVPAVDAQPGRMNDWAARRSGRLLYRTLTEFAGAGTEGGRYECPVGELYVEAIERRFSLQVAPEVGWSSGEAVLTGHDVSRRLLALADPGDPAYRADWAELLDTVAVDGVYRLKVGLRHAHVRPDAMLQTVLIPYATLDASRQPPLSNGPYVIRARNGNEISYLANDRYFATGPSQPREIVERHYPEGGPAIQALKRGEIDVLDRVPPWNLDQIRGDKDLAYVPYDVPLVHCLIPNMRKPLTACRSFRRALVYGIQREAILNRLVGGAESEGSRVLSGPFPLGRSVDDPIGYAYDTDPRLKPRPYQPRLAIALARVSFSEVAAAQKKKGHAWQEVPRLVLAHPGGEIARVACETIQRQLQLIGIRVRLQELQGPMPRQIPEDVDLLYAELAIWEPVVDARPLLGDDGMTGGCSPHLALALRRLEQARNWKNVHDRLQRIHRIAHDYVSVIPLWQLVDHFAYRKGLAGIGKGPLSLYQNVERWQVNFYYPAD